MVRRNTIQRSLVFDAVNRLRGHVTADEVYDEIAREHPTISRGTVYRNLNQLSESGSIRRVALPDTADRYDYQCHGHYHAMCSDCGQVFDVDMDYIADLEKAIRDSHGFEIRGHDILFRGICPECKKQASQGAGGGAENP